jgi:aminoglycoside phosphotransferase family enzyme
MSMNSQDLLELKDELVAQMTPAQREYLEMVRLEEEQGLEAFIARFDDLDQLQLAMSFLREAMQLEVMATLAGLTDESLDLIMAELARTHAQTKAQTAMMKLLEVSGTAPDRAA